MEKRIYILFIIILLLVGYTSQSMNNPKKISNSPHEHSKEAKPPELPSVKIKPEQPIFDGEDHNQSAKVREKLNK